MSDSPHNLEEMVAPRLPRWVLDRPVVCLSDGGCHGKEPRERERESFPHRELSWGAEKESCKVEQREAGAEGRFHGIDYLWIINLGS